MKIPAPKKIKIGSYVYKVKFQDDMILTNGTAGEHRPHTMNITIDPRTKHLTQTFLHEAIHCICYNYMMDMGEDDVNRFANGMAELFDSLNIKIDWD